MFQIEPVDEISTSSRSDIIDQDVVNAITASISGSFDSDSINFVSRCGNVPEHVEEDVGDLLTSLVRDVIQQEDPDRTIEEGTATQNEYAQRVNTSSTNVILDDNSLTIAKLKNIKMPPPVKVKGRPKGSENTNVIGTKKASKKKFAVQKFIEMRDSEKEKFVLSLCIGSETANLVLKRGDQVREDEVDPTEIGSAVFNSSVCLESVKYLFTDQAWNRFKTYYDIKSDHLKFTCCFCRKLDTNSDDLITCEHCLKGYHFSCVKLRKNVKKRQTWFCALCKAQVKVDSQSADS